MGIVIIITRNQVSYERLRRTYRIRNLSLRIRAYRREGARDNWSGRLPLFKVGLYCAQDFSCGPFSVICRHQVPTQIQKLQWTFIHLSSLLLCPRDSDDYGLVKEDYPSLFCAGPGSELLKFHWLLIHAAQPAFNGRTRASEAHQSLRLGYDL